MGKGVRVLIPFLRRSLGFLMQISPPHMRTYAQGSASCSYLEFDFICVCMHVCSCVRVGAHTHTQRLALYNTHSTDGQAKTCRD